MDALELVKLNWFQELSKAFRSCHISSLTEDLHDRLRTCAGNSQ
jgi:hypothetical protein